MSQTALPLTPEQIVPDHILINGSRVAHGVHGTGEPVVLIHGTPSSSYIWRNVMPGLFAAGYKVHLFDLLGYGLSERPRDPEIDTSMTAQTAVLRRLLDHWGLESTHLIVHDFGGGIAQRFGVESPERVRSLTMIDVVSYDSYPSKRTRQQMEAGLEALIDAPEAEHRAHFREWLLTAVHDRQKMTDGPLETYLNYISGPVGQASLIQHQVRHYDPKHTMELADRLHILGQFPVKLIWGEDDMWQVTDWAHRLQGDIPGSEL
ncbi:MAG: alpha/beta fold hydrolase, partial [Pikeienuella sp.]